MLHAVDSHLLYPPVLGSCTMLKGRVEKQHFKCMLLVSCVRSHTNVHAGSTIESISQLCVAQARAHKLQGNFDKTVTDLQEALDISKDLEEYSGDVDTLGALADVYVDKGDLESASKLYDKIIEAIQIEDTTQAISSSWDC